MDALYFNHQFVLVFEFLAFIFQRVFLLIV